MQQILEEYGIAIVLLIFGGALLGVMQLLCQILAGGSV